MTSGAVWKIPEPHSVHDVRHDDGSVTRVRRHGNHRGRRLLVGHGNGLAVDLYYPFWSRLLDDFDVFVYDLRNHGWNATGPRSGHNVPNMIRDQEQVVDAIAARCGRTPTIGVFHADRRTGRASSFGVPANTKRRSSPTRAPTRSWWIWGTLRVRPRSSGRIPR